MFGDRKAGVVDKPDPKAAGNYAVVKVHVVPMCTEYHHFAGGGVIIVSVWLAGRRAQPR